MVFVVARARPFYRGAPVLIFLGWLLCLFIAQSDSSVKFVALGYLAVLGLPLAVPWLRREYLTIRKHGVVSVSESVLYLWERRGYVAATQFSLESIDTTKLRLEFDEGGYLTLSGILTDGIRLRYWSLVQTGEAQDLTLRLREQVALRQE